MNTPELDKEYMEIDVISQFTYADLNKLNGTLMEAKIAILTAIHGATELELEAIESKLRGQLHFVDTNLLLIDMALSAKEENTVQDFGTQIAGVFYLN